MKKRFNTLVFTLAACYCLSFLPVFFTACANSTGGGSSGGEKKDDKKNESSLTFTGTKLQRTGRTEIINDNEIEILQFGDWPQTEKAKDVTIDKSQTVINGGQTYYKGSDGAWYAEIQAEFLGGNEPYKYFKVEPIEWYALTKNYSGKTLLMAKTVLTRMPYNDYSMIRYIDGNKIQSNDYGYSSIRAYLNGRKYEKNPNSNSTSSYPETKYEGKGFLQSAFDSASQELVESVTLDGEYEDKVFLLSENEVKNTAYGFQEYSYDDTIQCPSYGDQLINHKACDYAQLIDGIFVYISSGYFNWWLRETSDPDSRSRVAGIHEFDDAGKTRVVDGTLGGWYSVENKMGIVPALCINTSTYENLADVQPHVTKKIYKSTLKYLHSWTDGSFGTSKRYVTFGQYPQSEKEANVTIPEGAATEKHGSMTYVKGSDDNWYVKAGTKYFKVEPIKWCILTDNYNKSGKELLLAENILVNCNYYEGILSNNASTFIRSHQNTDYPANPNNYWDSTLRAFINGEDYYVRKLENPGEDTLVTKYKNQGFMYTAFNETDLDEIAPVKMDKLFILSLEELKDYGFTNDNRKRSATDFAKNNGTEVDSNNKGKWWTRTNVLVPKNDGSNTNNETDYALLVTPDGVVQNDDDTISDANVSLVAEWNNKGQFQGTKVGFVPALLLY